MVALGRPAVPLRALLVCAVLLLAGCTGADEGGGAGYVSADGQVTEVPAAERGDPVEVAGETVDGEEASLTDLRGQPVAVPVWGPWCAPCVKEAPALAGIARDYEDRASFLGIAIKNDGRRADSLAFEREHDLPYPSLYSSDGSELLAFDGGPRPRAVPSLVLLDAQGRVAAVILGDLPSERTVTTLLDDLVSETASADPAPVAADPAPVAADPAPVAADPAPVASTADIHDGSAATHDGWAAMRDGSAGWSGDG